MAVRGRLDHAHAKAFEASLAPHLMHCREDGAALVLDFAGVDYISSVALRVLLLAARQVKVQGGRIAIAALTPIVAEVFAVSHFDMVLPVSPDVATAATQLGRA